MNKIVLKWKVAKKQKKVIYKAAKYFTFKTCQPCGE